MVGQAREVTSAFWLYCSESFLDSEYPEGFAVGQALSGVACGAALYLPKSLRSEHEVFAERLQGVVEGHQFDANIVRTDTLGNVPLELPGDVLKPLGEHVDLRCVLRVLWFWELDAFAKYLSPMAMHVIRARQYIGQEPAQTHTFEVEKLSTAGGWILVAPQAG